MSEKRFTTKNIICSNYCVWDINDKPYGNDDVVVLLIEQQSTIRKLQDLCGESDGENAKLRIENKRLQEENEQLRQDQHIIGETLDSVIIERDNLRKENEQLKQEIKQYWKCRDKWKQEAKELKKEADYFERKKCEYWNMYNEAHLDRINLKKENEQLRQELKEIKENPINYF